MKNNKKYILTSVILIGFLLFSYNFYISFQRTGKKLSSNKPKVLTTFTVLEDMAKNVAGDRANIQSITKPGTEIHGYEPTPQDITKLQGADLILDNGMNLEKWAEKLYSNVPETPHVTLTNGIEPINIIEGPYLDKPNPHAWMSPSNALKYIDNIQNALIKIDPSNETYYKLNAKQYKKEIQKLDNKLKDELAKLDERNRFLTSCEGAFSYLIRDYNLKELYLWPINADAQGTPEQIKKVVDTVREHNIPAVFCESTVNGKAMHQVSNETGSKYGGVFYVDSLSGQDGPTSTYLKLLQYNSDILIKGLRE